MSVDGRLERAGSSYERAVFGGDSNRLATAERDLDALEADLALARAKILHARFLDERKPDQRELELFEQAARQYRELGEVRGEGEALFWVGTFHQVVREDHDAAVPVLERSYELAERAGDRLTVSYVLRHLAFADHAAGRLAAARDRMTESTRLRRELGFAPGVAANLVGLAYLAAADGNGDSATALLDEATAIATASAAHGILRQIETARQAV